MKVQFRSNFDELGQKSKGKWTKFDKFWGQIRRIWWQNEQKFILSDYREVKSHGLYVCRNERCSKESG